MGGKFKSLVELFLVVASACLSFFLLERVLKLIHAYCKREAFEGKCVSVTFCDLLILCTKFSVENTRLIILNAIKGIAQLKLTISRLVRGFFVPK